MSAHADDLRFFYAEDIGRTVSVTAADGVATPLAEPLEPGRYVLRILDFGGGTDCWVAQGPFGGVTAAAATPSMRFRAHVLANELNKPLLHFMVRAGDRNGLSFFSVGGDSIIQITKVSRGKS